MTFIVTGAHGLVGRAVVQHLIAQGEPVIPFDHAALNIADQKSVVAAFARDRPVAVINCAAFTDVDGCESDRHQAEEVNARGPEVLAIACREVDALLITISTDYVFDGETEGFYTEDDQPSPQSVYGVSKLEGERRAVAAWPRTIVVRSGYIFGSGGRNFLSTIVDRARRGESLKAIDDMFGTPTYARHLAERLCDLARLNSPGTYHVVNSGNGASFADFARLALEAAGLDTALVRPVRMDSLHRAAPRPRNSRLKSVRTDAIGLPPMPSWEQAVRQFVVNEAGQ